MRRINTLLAVFLAFSLLLPRWSMSPVQATQDGGPAIGVAVPYVDAEGVARGSITVTDVVDPYTAFDPANPPEEGSRFVLVTVAFDADAGQRFDVAPYTVVLQDANGFLWNQASVALPEDALIPEVANQTLSPGSRVTGVVGFVVPEISQPAQVFFQPESSRLIGLAVLSNVEQPGVGDPVPIVDSDGGRGSVTVTAVADSFEGFDPGQPPPEGTRFVLFTLAYENTSDGRFEIEPYGLLLRDVDGNLWSSTGVYRPSEGIIVPDLGSNQLAPGDRLSGVVGFAVPEGVALAGLHDSPVSGQLLLLADLQAASSVDEETGAVKPAVGTPAVAATDDCAAIETWLAGTRDRIREASAMSVEDAALEDPAALGDHVTAYVDLADAQRAEVAPAAAEPANKALIATLNAYSSAIAQILAAGDPSKDTILEVTEGMNTFNDAGGRLQEIQEELGRIAAGCGLS